MEQLFQNAKVGDKVIVYGGGRGVVEHIRKGETYSISVRFNPESCNDYMIDGRLYTQDLAPTCFPLDKAPQHLLDMFPEEKTFREYTSEAWGLFDTASEIMIELKKTRKEADEMLPLLVSTTVVVNVLVSFDLEVSA